MTSTTASRHIRAARSAVYAALVSADAVAAWRVPDGMTSVVHHFDPRDGGTFRVSLTYDTPAGSGKTAGRTDTYHGRFVALVPDQRVVEEIEFETTDPNLQGLMTITTSLVDADGGTDVEMFHDGLPPGVRPSDNDVGTRMALDRLARLVEGPVAPA